MPKKPILTVLDKVALGLPPKETTVNPKKPTAKRTEIKRPAKATKPDKKASKIKAKRVLTKKMVWALAAENEQVNAINISLAKNGFAVRHWRGTTKGDGILELRRSKAATLKLLDKLLS